MISEKNTDILKLTNNIKQKLRNHKLYNSKIQSVDFKDIIGVILIVSSVVAFFFGQFTLGIILLNAGLMLLLYEPPDNRQQTPNRGIPTYSGLNTDPNVVGAGKPIPTVFGISKVGIIILDKRIFGDFNSFGFFMTLISNPFGINGIVGMYHNEKPVQLIQSCPSETLINTQDLNFTGSTEENIRTIDNQVSDTENASKFIFSDDTNTNVYETYWTRKYIDNDPNVNDILVKLFEKATQNDSYLTMSYYITNVAGLTNQETYLNLWLFNYHETDNFSIAHSSSPNSILTINDTDYYKRFDRPINETFYLIHLSSFGKLNFSADYYYSDKIYVNIQNTITDMPDLNEVEIRLNDLQTSIYSLNTFEVISAFGIPLYEVNDNIRIRTKIIYSFSAGKQEASHLLFLKNKFTKDIIWYMTVDVGKFSNDGDYLHNYPPKDNCEDKTKGGELITKSYSGDIYYEQKELYSTTNV